MDLSKNACLFNKPPSMNTQVSKGERETTGVTGEWKSHTLKNAPLLSQGIDSRHPHDQHDFFLPLPAGVENRLVETALPAQEKVGILGNEFESLAIPAKNNCQITDKEVKAPAEMIDEETAPEIHAKYYQRFNDYQINGLENSFKNNPYLRGKDLEDFAEKLGVTKERVLLWRRRKRYNVKKASLKVTTVDSLDVSDKPSKSSTPKRKSRIRVIHFSYKELEILNKAFKQCKRPSSEMVTLIVKEAGLTRVQVQSWFSAQRCNEEKMAKEAERMSKLPLKKRGKPKVIKEYLDLRVVDEFRCIFKLYQNLTLKGLAYFSKKHGISDLMIRSWFKRERARYKRNKIKFGDVGETKSSVVSSKVVLSQSDLSPDLYRSAQKNSNAQEKRQSYPAADKKKLNEIFKKNPWPSTMEIRSIALMLGYQDARVFNWFTNRRTSMKVTCPKKGGLGVSDVLFNSVTPKKSGGPFSDSQVQQPHSFTRSIPSAALGAPQLSAEREDVGAPSRADAKLLLDFSRSGALD